ncbi:hypothetical protein D3C85_1367140 [compost metagenome]
MQAILQAGAAATNEDATGSPFALQGGNQLTQAIDSTARADGGLHVAHGTVVVSDIQAGEKQEPQEWEDQYQQQLQAKGGIGQHAYGLKKKESYSVGI